MKEEILKVCLEKGVLLDEEISNILSKLELEEVKVLIDKISSQFNEKIITKSFFSQNVEKIADLVGDDMKIIEELRLNFGLSLQITRQVKAKLVEEEAEEFLKEEEKRKDKEVSEFKNIKILKSYKAGSKKIDVGDFVKHFRNRFSVLRGILQTRAELENLVSINKISGAKQGLSIIGMVSAKRVTKNKNILLELEDLTGKISVLVNQNKPEIYEIAKNVLLDDVIGIKGAGDREMLFVNNIFYPDSKLYEKRKFDRDEAAAFIADLHVGSKMFLEENLLKFVDWLNGEAGNENQRKEALKIKYLFIVGDIVDGVGIFPGQEKLLDIKDIKEQYKKLAEILEKIRKDIIIVACPGQHDAVWVGEPQPAITEEYAAPLFELENLVLVSNPAMIEITKNFNDGIKVLMYHGASFNSYISEIEELRIGKAHDNPSKVVKEVLKRRHLASLHSAVTYSPNGIEDQLVIKETPDIIATADLHRPDVDVYNNILIVCSSCWQSITPFEEKVGNHPEPCKVPVLNLKTRQIKILDFS